MAVPWGCHGGLTWWKFEKMPPNSGGVAGLGWRRHGSRHSHGGRGGYGGVAENGVFFLLFVRGRSWADPTQPYPVIHSAKRPSSTAL